MPNYLIHKIKDVSRFNHSRLSFKYLGVPICAKTISSAECGVLLKIFGVVGTCHTQGDSNWLILCS